MRALTTPAFLVDRSIVERNCAAMRAKAKASNVLFRPHVKTHKTVEIARMQHGGGAGPITVSTMAEAEFFAAHGFGDITVAFPIAPANIPRAGELVRRGIELHLLLDDESTLAALEEFAASRSLTFGVFLKIDCGYGRAGLDPESDRAMNLTSRLLASHAVRLRGFLTHGGHAYSARTREEVLRAAADEVRAVRRIHDRAARTDLLRSIGSTPTATACERFEGVDEVRPGNYVFFDAFQHAIGSCRFEDVAVSVLTTVVGSYPEREAAIIDAGALALSKDPGAVQIDPAAGFGLVCDEALRPLPLRLTSLSQEHGKLTGAAVPPAGTKLRIVPNHSCLTAAMFDHYTVLEGGEVIDEWRPCRGW